MNFAVRIQSKFWRTINWTSMLTLARFGKIINECKRSWNLGWQWLKIRIQFKKQKAFKIVVKRTAMGNWPRFFFTMFSTSAYSSNTCPIIATTLVYTKSYVDELVYIASSHAYPWLPSQQMEIPVSKKTHIGLFDKEPLTSYLKAATNGSLEKLWGLNMPLP